MNPAAPYKGRAQKFGEITLWASASVLVLSAHIAAAALLLQQEPTLPADNAPPSAIMIELAPEPEAVNTEEEQIAPDASDAQEVKSEQVEPVEQAQPEPEPEPVEEPIEEPPPEVASLPEPIPPEPVVEEPPPEIAEPLPEPVLEPLPEPIVEPPPELVEQPDPLEQQMTAALENVEVPLPVVRPPPPAPEKPKEAKKPEPKKEPVKQVERRKQRQEQAQKEMAQAKAQATQSTRTAANANSAGSAFSSLSPATWKSRVQSRLARNARRCPGSDTGTAAVRFSFDGRGNVTSVSLSRSSGNAQIDDYIVSIVRRASPIPAPPAGVPSFLTQALTCS